MIIFLKIFSNFLTELRNEFYNMYASISLYCLWKLVWRQVKRNIIIFLKTAHSLNQGSNFTMYFYFFILPGFVIELIICLLKW